MKQPRFIPTEQYGLILETPIPLGKVQREAVKNWAIAEYKRRLSGLSGDRREAMVKVIDDLIHDRFLERPVPAYDFEKESLVYGK